MNRLGRFGKGRNNKEMVPGPSFTVAGIREAVWIDSTGGTGTPTRTTELYDRTGQVPSSSVSVGNNGSGGAADRDPFGQQRPHQLKGIRNSYIYKTAPFVVRIP